MMSVNDCKRRLTLNENKTSIYVCFVVIFKSVSVGREMGGVGINSLSLLMYSYASTIHNKPKIEMKIKVPRFF